MLSIRNLSVRRAERTVLQNVSLGIGDGEIVGLLGANGAGKSSLVMAIAGDLPVTEGSIELDGRSLCGLPPEAVRRLGVGAVPEGHPVLEPLSVRDNLRAAGSMLRPSELEEEIASALALFPELASRLTVAARNLSGGQKQMVCIAQALIARPRILLIDELSFGLAPVIVARLGQTLRRIAERGVGILLIEQFTTLALSLANEVHVLERGRLGFSGPAQALRDNPDILHGAYLARDAAVPAPTTREKT